MEAQVIFYPVGALILWTLIILIAMGSRRMAAVREGRVAAGYYKLYRGAEEPPHLAALGRHFHNLLELPPLFYITVVIAYLTIAVDEIMLGLAWAFVASRFLHSLVHITSNKVPLRFLLFLIGVLILAAMVILILFRL